MPGFQSFFRFLHHFVLAKLATSSIRVKVMMMMKMMMMMGNKKEREDDDGSDQTHPCTCLRAWLALKGAISAAYDVQSWQS